MAGGRRDSRAAGLEEERRSAASAGTADPPGVAFDPWASPARLELAVPDADGEGRATAARDRKGPVLLEVAGPRGAAPTMADPILLRFDEPVRAGPGSIRLVGEEGTIRVAARDAERVAIDGDTMRIALDRPLEPGASYTLELGKKAVRDLAGNPLQSLRGELLPVIEAAPVGDPGPAPAEWTLLVYMAADNDLEPYALRDLAEMERVALPSSIELVALVDRSPWYVGGPGDFTETRWGPVQPDGDPSRVGDALVSIGERNTGDPATLTAFLDWAAANFPAERYGLVVWNHGGGLEGVAWDDSSRGDRLTLAETRAAIERSALGRVDLLGFDACLMAMAEVASEVFGVAGVMVASQELEPGDGWAYDGLLRGLARDSAMDAVALARTLVESYAATYPGKRDITLSALDLGAMPNLEAALDDLAEAVARFADRGELRELAAAAEAARLYPRGGGYPYRDLGGFLDAVEARLDDPAIDAAARRALAALDSVVIAEAGTVGAASGLSIHLPGHREPAWPGYEPERFAFLGRTDWDALVDRLVAVG